MPAAEIPARGSVRDFEMRSSERSARAEREQGVATVEMAFVLPVLLVLVLGTFTLGEAVIMRFLMHSAAYDAARTCTLGGRPTTACATPVVEKKLEPVRKWCEGEVVKRVFDEAAQGLEDVSILRVELECKFVGGVGVKYLAEKAKLKIEWIRARAAMPH